MDSDEETVAGPGHSISQKRQERDRYYKGIDCYEQHGGRKAVNTRTV